MEQTFISTLITPEYSQYISELGLNEGNVMTPKPSTQHPSPAQALLKLKQKTEHGCGSRLCPTRKTYVFGEGNPKASLMFVGEGPGRDEDEKGRPFVGRAGELLNKIIEAMGFQRENVYISNVVKCRPPDNRQPQQDEIDLCFPTLYQEIDIIAPKILVALGRTALMALMPHQDKELVTLSSIRGEIFPWPPNPHIHLLPTYHPAYLLRNPPAKKIVWEDMKKVVSFLKNK